jgi:hypothetical protein
MTSDDGINWTLRTAPISAWTAITYGNGLFVAVAELVAAGNPTIITSPDGITWTPRSAPAADGQTWASVTFGVGSDGVGRYVAVKDVNPPAGGSPPRVMYSADGVTWAYGNGAPLNNWFSVTYGVGVDGIGRFVAVSWGGTDRIMTSTNGIDWSVVTDPTSKALGTSDFWYAVGFGGGKFVAATYGSTKVMTSSDGLVWTADTAFAADWRSVAYGNDTFVVVAENSAGTNPRVERFGPVAPAAPTQLSADPTLNSVSIAFTAGLANGSAITNYEYSLDGGVTFIALNPIDATSPITISGLAEGTTYQVVLRAVNSFGPGDASVTLTVTTLTPEPPQATSAPDLAASSDTGASDTDDLTADNTPTIGVAGTLNDHTVTVTATKTDESDVSCSFQATAQTSCDLGELADGVWSITSVQQATGGLVSEASSPLLITVDTSAPTSQPLQVDSSGTNLTLNFGEALDEARVATGGIVVTVDGNPVSLQQLTISGSTAVLELAAPALAGQTIVVSYDSSLLSDPNLALADLAGNLVVNFTLSISMPAAETVVTPEQNPIIAPPGVTPTTPAPVVPEAGTGVISPTPPTGSGGTVSEGDQEPLANTGFTSQQLFIWAVLLLMVGAGLTRQGVRQPN